MESAAVAALTPEQRQYLFVQSCLGAAIVNAILNGGIGWAILAGKTEFAVWTVPGAAADLIATAFGVAFGTVLAAAIGVRRDLARGKITAPRLSASLSELFSRLPATTFRRSIWLGVVSVLVFSPPVLLLCFLAGVDALERGAFVALKAGFAAVVAALVTPIIVVAALLDGARTRTAS